MEPSTDSVVNNEDVVVSVDSNLLHQKCVRTKENGSWNNQEARGENIKSINEL